MKIEQIYLYPVKSFRGVAVDSAILTRHGFDHDRTFMVMQVMDENGEKTYKNATIASYNELCRFFPAFNFPDDGEESQASMTVTHHPVNGGESSTIEIPLRPDTSALKEFDVLMHLSPTKAYQMDEKYNSWLSKCLGYECILAYIGDNLREVRMSADKYKTASNATAEQSNGWLASLASKATELVMGSGLEEVNGIRLPDVAPYLFVSSKSMDDCNRRLADGEQMDITKFRPNVIVSGAERPWDEDFWGELTIGKDAKVELEHNCGRCRSINVDYETGAQGTGEAGKMLKKLASDRRVDKGTKWSPIFGRYAFLHPSSEGKEIKVGHDVDVSRLNRERTAFGKFSSVELLIDFGSMLTETIDWQGYVCTSPQLSLLQASFSLTLMLTRQ